MNRIPKGFSVIRDMRKYDEDKDETIRINEDTIKKVQIESIKGDESEANSELGDEGYIWKMLRRLSQRESRRKKNENEDK